MSDNSGGPGGGWDSAGSDSFTETTSQSWFSRLGGALKGILVGLILLPIAGWLLFWNEGRAVQTARSLTEGAGLVQSVSPERPDAANEGRLVHVAGEVRAPRPPEDAELKAIPPPGTLRLDRRVEMYQWVEETSSETRNKLGGGTETVTTYNYRREWREGRVDSGRFRQPEGHQNPQPRHASRSFIAPGVTLGGFRLSESQLAAIPASETFVPDGFGAEGGLYLGADAASPRVGDQRVTWRVARPDAVTVIGAQVGDGFGPYATRAGDRLLMIQPGRATAAAMFQEAQDSNAAMTWILRLVGVVVMFIGWSMIFNPLKVLADVIPPVGAIVGFGTGLVAAILTAVLAPAIIAVAWLVYRPLVGIAILAAGLAIAYGLTRLRRSRPLQGKPA